MRSNNQERRVGWSRAVTLKDVVIFEIASVILTVILIFTIAGLMSQGQQTLAERVDRNADLSATGSNGVRCFLHQLNETPGDPVSSQEIHTCYTQYDEAYNRYYGEAPDVKGGE